MKKRLAMIVTMLMVTVSMAACGGKKDTTADKETVINRAGNGRIGSGYRDRRAGNRGSCRA